MICRRLVVNCRKNPSHSCCKFEEPPKNDIEEDAKKDNIVEEVTNKTVEIVVETTQNINEVEVSTISLESNIESLKTLPELTIEEKGTNNAPVIRNDIVKQRLEARRIPSSKGSIKYKTIRLNTRERTRNVNTRKPAEQVVATIEAVPLDIVERDNPTNKRKLSEGKNDVSDSTRQVSQGLKKASTTVQTLENGTTTHLSHVPLVELPLAEEEPYERIPAECFTMSFDCKTSPSHMCCAYHE